MAKYTQLLAEYLENGGSLPAVFDQIDGFKDLFLSEYCDSELGFETPTLFNIKLNARAELIIPAYLERIKALEEAQSNLIDPTKKHVKSGVILRVYGERTSGTADQPMNIISIAPNAFDNPASVTTDKEHSDQEKYNEVTDTDSGYTPAEAEALYKALESKVFILKRELLKEFKNLFMVIY